MDHVFHPAGAAPVDLRLEEVVAEHRAPHIPVVGLRAHRLGREFHAEELWNERLQVVSFRRAEGFKQFRRPRHEAGVVGLVAAKPEDRFPKFVTDDFLVGVVDEVNVGARRFGIEVVDECVIAVLVGGAVVAVGVTRRRTAVNVADKHHFVEPGIRRSPLELAAGRQRQHC